MPGVLGRVVKWLVERMDAEGMLITRVNVRQWQATVPVNVALFDHLCHSVL